MIATRILTGATALACALALAPAEGRAKAADYRFELVGKPQLSAKKEIVQIRLVRAADGKPAPDAVIFEAKADMGPAGMETMTAPVRALPPKAGVYSYLRDSGGIAVPSYVYPKVLVGIGGGGLRFATMRFQYAHERGSTMPGGAWSMA